MPEFTSTYIVLTAAAGMINLLIAFYALFSRMMFPGKRIFILMSFANSLYTLGAAFEKTASTLNGIMAWVVVQYAGMPFAAPLTLLLALQFLGKSNLLPAWGLRLLFVIPTLTFAMAATNHLHHLFYKKIFFHPDALFPTMDFTMGEWYVVHGCYTFASLFVALCLVFQALIRPVHSVHRMQLIALFFAILLPIVSSFLYLIGLSPYGVDPVPVVLCFTSLLIIYAFLSTDKMAVLPVARERVMESMGEGVLVVDASWRLLDSNHSARTLIPGLSRSALGQRLHSMGLPEEAATSFKSAWDNPGKPFSFASGTPDSPRWREVYASPIRRDKGLEEGFLLVLSDITERRLLQEELRRIASLDPLTGILNRGAFMEGVEIALTHHAGEHHLVSLILFDIDHFKSINDTYGHETGDLALQHTVRVCRDHLDSSVLFARYGGEEFILLLPGANTEAALLLAETLRSAIENSAMNAADGRMVRIRASFGVSSLLGAESFQQLFRGADSALYAAKSQGRNRVCLEAATDIRFAIP